MRRDTHGRWACAPRRRSLRPSCCLPSPIGNAFAFARAAAQGLRYVPVAVRIAGGARVMIHAVDDAAQPDVVRHPHGPATEIREAEAARVYDVDVAGAIGDAFLEDARAFVDQRI